MKTRHIPQYEISFPQEPMRLAQEQAVDWQEVARRADLEQREAQEAREKAEREQQEFFDRQAALPENERNWAEPSATA
jgi:hypothetical protein